MVGTKSWSDGQINLIFELHIAGHTVDEIVTALKARWHTLNRKPFKDTGVRYVLNNYQHLVPHLSLPTPVPKRVTPNPRSSLAKKQSTASRRTLSSLTSRSQINPSSPRVIPDHPIYATFNSPQPLSLLNTPLDQYESTMSSLPPVNDDNIVTVEENEAWRRGLCEEVVANGGTGKILWDYDGNSPWSLMQFLHPDDGLWYVPKFVKEVPEGMHVDDWTNFLKHLVDPAPETYDDQSHLIDEITEFSSKEQSGKANSRVQDHSDFSSLDSAEDWAFEPADFDDWPRSDRGYDNINTYRNNLNDKGGVDDTSGNDYLVAALGNKLKDKVDAVGNDEVAVTTTDNKEKSLDAIGDHQVAASNADIEEGDLDAEGDDDSLFGENQSVTFEDEPELDYPVIENMVISSPPSNSTALNPSSQPAPQVTNNVNNSPSAAGQQTALPFKRTSISDQKIRTATWGSLTLPTPPVENTSSVANNSLPTSGQAKTSPVRSSTITQQLHTASMGSLTLPTAPVENTSSVAKNPLPAVGQPKASPVRSSTITQQFRTASMGSLTLPTAPVEKTTTVAKKSPPAKAQKRASPPRARATPQKRRTASKSKDDSADDLFVSMDSDESEERPTTDPLMTEALVRLLENNEFPGVTPYDDFMKNLGIVSEKPNKRQRKPAGAGKKKKDSIDDNFPFHCPPSNDGMFFNNDFVVMSANADNVDFEKLEALLEETTAAINGADDESEDAPPSGHKRKRSTPKTPKKSPKANEVVASPTNFFPQGIPATATPTRKRSLDGMVSPSEGPAKKVAKRKLSNEVEQFPNFAEPQTFTPTQMFTVPQNFAQPQVFNNSPPFFVADTTPENFQDQESEIVDDASEVSEAAEIALFDDTMLGYLELLGVPDNVLTMLHEGNIVNAVTTYLAPNRRRWGNSATAQQAAPSAHFTDTNLEYYQLLGAPEHVLSLLQANEIVKAVVELAKYKRQEAQSMNASQAQPNSYAHHQGQAIQRAPQPTSFTPHQAQGIQHPNAQGFFFPAQQAQQAQPVNFNSMQQHGGVQQQNGMQQQAHQLFAGAESGFTDEQIAYFFDNRQ